MRSRALLDSKPKNAPVAAMRRRFRRPGTTSGFTLALVVWALGLIGLLIGNFANSAHWRSQASANIAETARAEELAESSIAVASLALVRQIGAAPGAANAFSGRPSYCRSADGAEIAVAIESEMGKIDLNSASPDLISTLFIGLRLNASKAKTLSTEIVAFRSKQFIEDENAIRLKQSLFQSPFELDQIPGIDRALFEQVLPYVTVHSRSTGINRSLAPDRILAVLGGGLPFRHIWLPPEFLSMASGDAYFIHAEVAKNARTQIAREKIIIIRPGAHDTIVVKEARSGKLRFLSAVDQGSNMRPCGF